MHYSKIPRLAFTCLLATCIIANVSAQNKPDLASALDSLVTEIPALDERIDITVNSVSVSEFMRGVAKESGLNINIDPALTQPVTNNFSNVRVCDILLFISHNYNIEVSFIGNIVNLKSPVIVQAAVSPGIIISYQSETGNISIEANGVPADQLAREITRRTGNNVIVTPGVQNAVIRSFIKDMPFASAIDKIAVGNNMKASYSDDGFYILETADPRVEQARVNASQRGMTNGGRSPGDAGLVVNAYTSDSIDVFAVSAGTNEIISRVFEQLKLPYQLLSPVTESVTLRCSGVTVDDLLTSLFSGTKTTFRKEGEGFLIGPREMLEMQVVKTVSMQYRTVDSLLTYIPEKMISGLEILEMTELNSLIISGPGDRVNNLESFLKSIDKIVPVVLIEVLIVENSNSKALSTGITMGLNSKGTTTSGVVSPGIDMTLGAGSVNDLIDGLNGFGWVNLGKVTPNFYMTLEALEEDGYIEIQSTPQLATLNGHKATMSIGNTEYYKEELSTLYGSVTTSTQISTTYKAVEAELKVTIRPIVSGSQFVTLEIEVEQSDFTERISEYAPPGKVSRKFQSMIRVKDQEMILMGGLEEKEKKDIRSGMPLLSRIPVINWIFTSKTKSNTKSKLNVFIKPTIIS